MLRPIICWLICVIIACILFAGKDYPTWAFVAIGFVAGYFGLWIGVWWEKIVKRGGSEDVV